MKNVGLGEYTFKTVSRLHILRSLLPNIGLRSTEIRIISTILIELGNISLDYPHRRRKMGEYFKI